VLEVFPLQQAGGPRHLFVVFKEQPVTTPSPTPADASAPTARRILELERELATAKETLHETIEQLEAANEELQSSNEELQSTCEEYQSTNEELATAKEEVQSANEELSTVNDELQQRMRQLLVSGDDLQNLLLVTPTVVLIVGLDQGIRRYSAAAERLFGLHPQDVGRSVASLKTMVPVSLEKIVASVIETVSPQQHNVRCMDGLWYVMRVSPYKGSDQTIRGALLEFSKAWFPRAEDVSDGGDWGVAFLGASEEPILALDHKLRVFWVNRAFLRTFGVDAEVVGKTLDQLYSRPVGPAETWSRLEDAAVGGRPFRDLRVERPFGRVEAGPMTWSAVCIPAEGERPPLTLITMRAERPPADA
jgi:two-component system CheB/CheR fusion protein